MAIGQTPNRPYSERQKIPGDYDAMVSQGGIAPHSLENLGSLDRGVVLFRRLLKDGIKQVEQGQDPPGLDRSGRLLPTYGTDRVSPLAEFRGDPSDPDALLEFARLAAASCLESPPFATGKLAKPVPMPARAAA
jgi:hypothetical protein